ncbi:hypothetical protein ABZ550_31790 [Streptomyces hygroscopicus]
MGRVSAHDAVGSLRTEALGRPATPTPGLVDLIEELATRGEEFARRGDPPDVEYYRSGQQCFHHPPSAPRASDQGRMFGSVQENGFGPTFWWCAGFSGSRA